MHHPEESMAKTKKEEIADSSAARLAMMNAPGSQVPAEPAS
jgi:hypothetical protein